MHTDSSEDEAKGGKYLDPHTFNHLVYSVKKV